MTTTTNSSELPHKKSLSLLAVFLRLLKLSVAVGLIALLITRIDWASVGALLRGVNPYWLCVYVGVVLFGNLISVLRWQQLASIHGLTERAHTLFAWYVTASFINNFLPGFIGGDTYRAYHLGHKNGAVLPAAFSVIVDRAIGLFGILILASSIGVIWFFDLPTQQIKLMITSVIVLTFVVWLCMMWREEIIAQLAQFLPKKYTQYALYTRDYTTRVLWLSTLWGVVFGLIGVGIANYILFIALGTTLPFMSYLFFALIASVISSVPLSIGNIGIKEWAYITLFGLMSVSAPTAVAVVLLGRVTQALISTLGVPLYFMQARKNKNITAS